MTDALWPFRKTPVLKLPLLAVAVWSLGPLLDQSTVPPTCRVIVNGVKLKSAIVTPGSERRRRRPAWIEPRSAWALESRVLCLAVGRRW